MQLKIYSAMAVILVSGLVIGFFAGQHCARQHMLRMMREGPKHMESILTAKLAKKLDLTATQLPAAREKVRQMAADFERLLQSHRHEMDQRTEQLLQDMRGILAPEQQKLLEGMTADDLKPRRVPRCPPPRPTTNQPPAEM